MYVYYDGVQVTSTNANKPFPFSTNPTNGQDLVPKVKEWLWLSVGASFGDGDFQSQPNGLLSDAQVDYVRVYKPSQTLSLQSNPTKSFQFYPNPIENYLNITAQQPNFKVTVLDVNGKSLLHQKETSNQLQLDFSTLSKGVYFLQIQQNQKVTVKKVVL